MTERPISFPTFRYFHSSSAMSPDQHPSFDSTVSRAFRTVGFCSSHDTKEFKGSMTSEKRNYTCIYLALNARGSDVANGIFKGV